MSLYKQFQTDKELEKDGIVVQYGENSKGQATEFRIARAGGANEAYTKRAEVVLKPYRRQIQTETIENKLAEKLLMGVFVDTVLKGWSNVEDEKGKDLPFTRENAIKLFTDLPDLYRDLREQSDKSALFRLEILEADAGN